MAGLPEMSFDEVKTTLTVNDFKNELENILSDKDKKLMFYFFLKFDCMNLVKLLKSQDAEISPNGNYSLEQYQDLIKSAKDMNFNVHRYPAFMSTYARDFFYNKDKVDFFPEDAMSLEYYKYSVKCPNKAISRWFQLNFDMTNILTAMIARKNGWNVSDYILGNNEICEMIRNNNTKDFNLTTEYDYIGELMKIVDCENPVEKEKKIDFFKWTWLDELSSFNIFSIEAVFAYMCKLEILERWNKLDIETGREAFKRIIDNLREEVRVPEEFKK
ncbi:MAG: DUF2764 domain-containing protein [Roseburia sp.]|nr:DUF2764 domain-containing protein [Roseburia sp.]